MSTRSRKIDDLADKLGKIEELVDRVDRRVEKIEMVTLIREPNSGMAADAYNGLRKQVIAAMTERNAHLHQLTQFDSAVRTGANQDDLTALVRGWLAQSGIQVVSDAGVREAFEFVGPEDGTSIRVVRPAYVDGATGRVIQSGVAERTTIAIDSTAPPTPAVPLTDGAADGEAALDPQRPADVSPSNPEDAPDGVGPVERPDAYAGGPAAVDNATENTSPSNEESTT